MPVLRDAAPSDAARWEALRTELWPDGAAGHAVEIAMFFAGTLNEPSAVLMAENEVGEIVGFVELSIRSDIAGLEGQRTGYVEGLYIRTHARGLRAAQQMLRASRAWARRQKCTAFASDRAGRVVIDRRFKEVT